MLCVHREGQCFSNKQAPRPELSSPKVKKPLRSSQIRAQGYHLFNICWWKLFTIGAEFRQAGKENPISK